jgi:hypothetical protein
MVNTQEGFSYNGSNPVGFVEAAQLRIASSEDRRWENLDSVRQPFLWNRKDDLSTRIGLSITG